MRKAVRLTPRQKTKAPAADPRAHRSSALKSNRTARAFLAAVCASEIARNAASRTPLSDCKLCGLGLPSSTQLALVLELQ